ncbi:MAG: formylglycine-generating enzyme family protein, partial [Gammaproteobacteria bacterium]|nr:formylglycine-generating enzyme family protein [Gammaproteobacteria bacterium]
NVSWADAAGFANWMSARDKLQPAYELRDGRIAGFNPRADGYRLLSEAEWEWLARVAGRIRTGRFVWGNTETIPKGSGNFADESAKGAVPKYIPRYDDGYAGVAPVGSFAPDPAGLYDVAGNVSEWVHGAHDLRPPAPETQVNPFGPVRGAERVVKGASFRSASLVELRASYRQGVSRARDDVGFRVARYVYGGAE